MDYSVTNPKRAIDRREQEAEGGAKPPETAASGGMSQSDFGRGRKLTAAEEALKQKKLAAKLRTHHQQDFVPSTY